MIFIRASNRTGYSFGLSLSSMMACKILHNNAQYAYDRKHSYITSVLTICAWLELFAGLSCWHSVKNKMNDGWIPFQFNKCFGFRFLWLLIWQHYIILSITLPNSTLSRGLISQTNKKHLPRYADINLKTLTNECIHNIYCKNSFCSV